MSDIASKVRESLTRKLGPLPVWAWALMLGAGIFLYRTARGQYTAGGGADASTSEPPESPEPQEPFTVGPGESVFDPNTGQLVHGSPDQGDTPEPMAPVTLKPGQSVFDPNTGKLVTAPAPKPPKRKRKPKPKPHHGRGKKPGPRGHGRNKPRGGDKVKNPHPRHRHKPPSHPSNGRKRPQARATQIFRRTPSSTPRWGVMRQRPPATHPAPSTDARNHPKAHNPKPRKPRRKR